VSNLLFFRRSLAYRHAALEMMRQARAMPYGPERSATRHLARAMLDLAKTEEWLEGQPRPRSRFLHRGQPQRTVSSGG
jgi:hypothetical protein